MASAGPSAAVPARPPKRSHPEGGRNKHFKKRKSKREKTMESGTKEEILGLDIAALVGQLNVSDAATESEKAPRGIASALPEPGTEIEVKVCSLSSTGEGLAVPAAEGSTSRVYVVTFAVPGDVLKVKVFRHLETHSIADFVSLVSPGPERDDGNVKCKYFGTCSGCQFQMMPYPAQLRHKQDVVKKAFANFSGLKAEQMPQVGETIASPLQFGYRTKLTPHFDGPPGKGKKKQPLEKCPAIGYTEAGRRVVMDIEDCPIGTEAVRKGMQAERERMGREYGNYTNGATILLRESTKRIPKRNDTPPQGLLDDGEEVRATAKETNSTAVIVEEGEYTDIKTCVTEHHAPTTEYVGKYIFTNPAGSFFQNNNSILPVVTDYVRERIAGDRPIRYLVDAYSGSGLFTITLASLFSANPASPTRSLESRSPPRQTGGSIGIDISGPSIEYARANAKLNCLSQDQCRFIAADANELFASVKDFNPDDTAVVLDPPRKGCDANFLRQLLAFGPRRVVYVSCNVHTQARDVGCLVRGSAEGFGKRDTKGEMGEDKDGADAKEGARYEIESLVGFDFFPQTSHVEGVVVLNRVGS